MGQSGCSLCPVGAMLDYLVVRGAGPGPLFRFVDGSQASRTGQRGVVKGWSGQFTLLWS